MNQPQNSNAEFPMNNNDNRIYNEQSNRINANNLSNLNNPASQNIHGNIPYPPGINYTDNNDRRLPPPRFENPNDDKNIDLLKEMFVKCPGVILGSYIPDQISYDDYYRNKNRYPFNYGNPYNYDDYYYPGNYGYNSQFPNYPRSHYPMNILNNMNPNYPVNRNFVQSNINQIEPENNFNVNNRINDNNRNNSDNTSRINNTRQNSEQNPNKNENDNFPANINKLGKTSNNKRNNGDNSYKIKEEKEQENEAIEIKSSSSEAKSISNFNKNVPNKEKDNNAKKEDENSCDWILCYKDCVWDLNKKKLIAKRMENDTNLHSFKMYAIGDNAKNSYIFLQFIDPLCMYDFIHKFKIDDKEPVLQKADNINDLIEICGNNSLYVSNSILINNLNKEIENNINQEKITITKKNDKKNTLEGLWIKDNGNIVIDRYLTFAQKRYFIKRLDHGWEGYTNQRIVVFKLDEILDEDRDVKNVIFKMLSDLLINYCNINKVDVVDVNTKIIFIVSSKYPLEDFDSKDKILSQRFKQLDLAIEDDQKIFVKILEDMP